MTPAVVGLLGILLGGGFLGAIVTFRKAGTESSAIAMESLIKVNEELRKELNRLNGEVEKLRTALERRGPL